MSRCTHRLLVLLARGLRKGTIRAEFLDTPNFTPTAPFSPPWLDALRPFLQSIKVFWSGTKERPLRIFVTTECSLQQYSDGLRQGVRFFFPSDPKFWQKKLSPWNGRPVGIFCWKRQKRTGPKLKIFVRATTFFFRRVIVIIFVVKAKSTG